MFNFRAEKNSSEYMLKHPNIQIQKDIEAIGQIPVVENILEVICRTTGMGFATIARVTKDRWVACAVRDDIQFGLARGGELELETTICYEIEQSGNGVIIEHVAEDKEYANHLTPATYGFQSYISIPIILKDGRFFGTLCAIDPKPAKINTPEIIGMFKLFADLIAFHLQGIEQLALAESRLLEERKTSELRDQFIAILGHDLRNPVGAIRNSAQLLQRMPLNDRALRLANIIQDSSYRITGLIENVLDFARGRLGEGITLNRSSNESMEKLLLQVITELQTIWPKRIIEAHFDLSTSINCDGKRIAQLFSNLLGNALTYGPEDKPVKVKAFNNGSEFTLLVSNTGEMIPTAKIERLFQPFSRGTEEQNKEGLGLGLYIASEIARAHEGTLSVTSTQEETCFILNFHCGC